MEFIFSFEFALVAIQEFFVRGESCAKKLFSVVKGFKKKRHFLYDGFKMKQRLVFWCHGFNFYF